MIRGAVPPSNQEWLENLPTWHDGVEGLGIYTGSINGYQNLVFSIAGDKIKIAEYDSGGWKLWSFDLEQGFVGLEHSGAANDYINAMMQGAGIEGYTADSARNVRSLSRNDVAFKIVPAE